MKITFCGGALSVTGANYLLEHGSTKMLVDCGLFQGSRFADDLNYEPFAYNPADIDYLIITHSHIDHIGRVPKLFKDGFRGQIITTSATADMMRVTLPDNMQHITTEARAEGREPLFDEADLNGALGLLWPVRYHEHLELTDGVSIELFDAGHILGSAICHLKWVETDGIRKSMAFTGDLGNPPTPLLKPTEYVSGVDYVVIESAYGDRLHEDRSERRARLREIVIDTMNGKGVLMIPSFAVERTQELLYELDLISHEHSFEGVPVFVDSPLAIKMTDVYRNHEEYFNKDAEQLISSGDDIFNFNGLQMTASVEASKAINDVPAPKIIIAGSGMSQGGRILHHERRYLSDPNSAILFVGYQVGGSLGRRIQDGQEEVRIFGETIPVRCRRFTIGSYSAHADQNGLVNWIHRACGEDKQKTKLKQVFIVQGEERATEALGLRIKEETGLSTHAPSQGESFVL